MNLFYKNAYSMFLRNLIFLVFSIQIVKFGYNFEFKLFLSSTSFLITIIPNGFSTLSLLKIPEKVFSHIFVKLEVAKHKSNPLFHTDEISMIKLKNILYYAKKNK